MVNNQVNLLPCHPYLDVQMVAILKEHCVPSQHIALEVLLSPSDHRELVNRDIEQPPFNVSLQATVLNSIPLLQYLRPKDGVREHHIGHKEVILAMEMITHLTKDLPLSRVQLVQVDGIARGCIRARVLTGNLVDVIQHPSLTIDGLLTRNRRWTNSGHVPWSIVTTLHSVWTRPSDTASRVEMLRHDRKG